MRDIVIRKKGRLLWDVVYQVIKKIVNYLKENRWKTIYYTNKTEKYARIKGILNDSGVITKTKASSPYGSSQLDGFGTCYDILVKQKDLHKAYEVLSKIKK